MEIEDTGHVTVEARDSGWYCTHVQPTIWFSDHSGPNIFPDHLFTRTDDYMKLECANGTWIWKFTGRVGMHRFAGEVHEAIWPD